MTNIPAHWLAYSAGVRLIHEGSEARRFGLPVYACPYAPLTAAALAWLTGWTCK